MCAFRHQCIDGFLAYVVDRERVARCKQARGHGEAHFSEANKTEVFVHPSSFTSDKRVVRALLRLDARTLDDRRPLVHLGAAEFFQLGGAASNRLSAEGS